MTKGEDSKNQNENNNNVPGLSENDLARILKPYQEQVLALQKRLDERNDSPSDGKGLNANDIMALADAITQKTKKELNYQEGVTLEQVPKEDYLDQKDWVRFCVPSAGYVIADDRRMGHIVKLPFGKPQIFFEYLLTNKKALGKHTATIPVATYTCKSKAEVKWIREHSKFDTLIFEDMQKVGDTTVEKALRLGRIMESLNTQEFANIIQQAKSFDIPFHSNPEELKKQLAKAMIDREYQEESMVTAKIADEAWKSKLMLEGKA